MNPHASFLAELALMDPELTARFVPWREYGEEVVTVWPVKGRPFQASPEALPQRGRFVIFEKNRITGQQERVFDVVHPDGHYMPLDRRALAGLGLRRMWSEMRGRELEALARKTAEVEAAARKSETVSALQSDDSYVEAMESMFRETTGDAGRFALGAPGSPAAARTGGRSAGVEYEDTVGPPPPNRDAVHEAVVSKVAANGLG